MQNYIGGLVAELAGTEEHDGGILLGNRGQGVRRRGIKIAQVVGRSRRDAERFGIFGLVGALRVE